MTNKKHNNIFKILMELGKVRITFAVSLTTITAYVIAKGGFDSGLILPTLGIFLLACGSSAINHFQERDKDSIMERTKDRPIPSGRISAGMTLLIAFIWSATGAYLIWLGSNLLAMQLGLLALIWYNAIYTPLKKVTAFAVVPGSVIGAIPPVVGWIAGGGSLSDPRIMILAFFFFIWQVPHFWLLLLKFGKEYEKAGFPSLTSIYSNKQIKNITFIWTLSTAITALMIPAFDIINSMVIKIGFLLAALWLIIVFSRLILSKKETFSPFFFFMRINYFVLTILVLLIADIYMPV
ncbi:MAG: protoheme IX farnesyltransferase [Bacteroidales bacterium]|nr:protoheme IX farnesyltransferase [Bacteroidales bacterium]MCF8349551.1 protoheme IX farnesyltransferase [Bacteroidales bacterium]MCF8375110.1 protoheme IX farnesyltransferase [Bacteroidales bacterium]MCF8400017.1 protoheme IX farnesyltransferase [Bacteroidales bacterium]